MPEPLYLADNCRVAYQLHWSLTLFTNDPWPDETFWREPLKQSMGMDGVRLLEFRCEGPETGQFFLSSRPETSPSEIVRSVKGRLQYLLRASVAKLWRRHYSISSVGDANNDALQGYVARQVQHHPMADVRMEQRLSQTQFDDPSVDLTVARTNAYGRFTYNLHLVLENADHLHDVSSEWLEKSRATIIAGCKRKGWLLSRAAIVSNHLHVLLGCDAVEKPQNVALSLLNNLAFAHGMKPVYEYSYYVGTFGPYDHNAIRLKLVEGAF
jgi:REP element-mobilizing transposase RayT